MEKEEAPIFSEFFFFGVPQIRSQNALVTSPETLISQPISRLKVRVLHELD